MNGLLVNGLLVNGVPVNREPVNRVPMKRGRDQAGSSLGTSPARTQGWVLIDALFGAVVFVTVALPVAHAWITAAERRAIRQDREVRRLQLAEWYAVRRVQPADPSEWPALAAAAAVRVEWVAGDQVEWVVVVCRLDPTLRWRTARPVSP